MEEKERYELINYCDFIDTETGFIGDRFVDVLNKQDKQIKELEKENNELKQSQKQLAISKLEKVLDVVKDYNCEESQHNPYFSTFDIEQYIATKIKELKGE